MAKEKNITFQGRQYDSNLKHWSYKQLEKTYRGKLWVDGLAAALGIKIPKAKATATEEDK